MEPRFQLFLLMLEGLRAMIRQNREVGKESWCPGEVNAAGWYVSQVKVRCTSTEVLGKVRNTDFVHQGEVSVYIEI